MPLGTTSAYAKGQGIDPREYRPKGGESWKDVNARIHSFFKDMMANHLGNKEREEVPKVVCVSHGGWITEVLNVLQELQGEEPKVKDKVKNCAIYVFKIELSEEGRLSIESIIENDDSHLTEIAN